MNSPQESRVCVVGLGYIGLPTAAILASRGYHVHGVDVNQKTIDTINMGKAHVVEPDLDILVKAAVQTGKLKAFDSPVAANIFILCVPTPVDSSNQPDLRAVQDATLKICPYLEAGNLVILESTSPPGTTEMIAGIVEEQSGLSAEDVFIAHAPERVLPGKILREVVENDRIIGGVNEASTQAAVAFYKTFVTGELLLCDARMAEMAKLVENTSRDVQIAFANELSILCDEQDIDVRKLIDLANRHPRVNILQPGCGVGGHCIAVDPWFLIHQSPQTTQLIRTAREVNRRKPRYIVEKIIAQASRFKHPKIACLGLAYKPDIDDLRESPALGIVHELQHKNVGDLLIVEPNIECADKLELVTLETALRKADIVVFLVSHAPFKEIDPTVLTEKIIIDACGALHGP